MVAMMDILVKVFLTYTAISMISAMFIFFLEAADIVEMKSAAPFVILWAGPFMLAASFGLPYALYRFWM